MYSLNAPVPGRIRRLADDLAHELLRFERVRERHSLLVKRLGEDNVDALAERVRTALRGAPAFEARVTGIDYFERATSGSSPVAYLAVESPGLLRLHGTLTEAFGAIEGLEGDDYEPHVTLARDGPLEAARDLADRPVEQVSWTVSELHLREHRWGEVCRRFSLPA